MTFDEYLTEQCFKDNPQVLDDDMPDFFERWLERLDTAEVIEYAEKALSQVNKEAELDKKLREGDTVNK